MGKWRNPECQVNFPCRLSIREYCAWPVLLFYLLTQTARRRAEGLASLPHSGPPSCPAPYPPTQNGGRPPPRPERRGPAPWARRGRTDRRPVHSSGQCDPGDASRTVYLILPHYVPGLFGSHLSVAVTLGDGAARRNVDRARGGDGGDEAIAPPLHERPRGPSRRESAGGRGPSCEEIPHRRPLSQAGTRPANTCTSDNSVTW
jgi:hypothetical protein